MTDALHRRIEALYARYAALLDEGPLSEWPALFFEDGVYKAVTAENVERGWPLALMLCEFAPRSRIESYAIENIALTIPRRMRHLYSGLVAEETGSGAWTISANFAIFETIVGQPTVCFAAGRYRDVVARRLRRHPAVPGKNRHRRFRADPQFAGVPLLEQGLCKNILHYGPAALSWRGRPTEDEPMPQNKNTVFEIQGVNHLALVCRDMARTVDFYTNVLGMPLIRTIELPNGMGQHFFFDIGNGDSLAFFWFPNAPEAQPGVASAANLPMSGTIVSAHGSMNHVALNVPADKIDAYHDMLAAKGVVATKILNHDDSERQVSLDVSPSTFVRSIYFFDPDGICLEFAAWTRPSDPKHDVKHEPVDAKGQHQHSRELEKAR